MAEPNFFDRVYEVARQIPAGRVTSYGAIARYLGTAGSSRVVGYAMGASVEAYPPVPAHRVVNRIGLITGNLQGSSFKRRVEMLESEGVKVEDEQVQDFKKVFWDPMLELG
jgi:methylated-DNA-protein-cysteine methyltransferase-like protein